MSAMLLVVAWLLTYLVHSTLLLGGAWLLSSMGLVRSSAARDVMWKVAMVGALFTATTQAVLRVEPVAGHVSLAAVAEWPIVEAASVRPRLVAPGPAEIARATTDDAGTGAPLPPAPMPQRRAIGSFHAGWPGALLNLWMFGAMACAIRLFWARAELRRRLRRRDELCEGPMAVMLEDLRREAGCRRRVRVTVSDAVQGPISFGSNEICLPARAVTELRADEQRAVLAHELGHLMRRDPWWQMLAAVLASALFFQPLNRLARRRLQELAEYLCDDWAAERTDGLVLARCLAEVATWMQAGPELAAMPAMAARPSQLVSRVQRLLDGRARPVGRAMRLAVGMAGVGAMALVAWSVPGVAADDLSAAKRTAMDASDAPVATYASWDGAASGWLSIRDGGRLLVITPGYSVRLTGQGRIGFRQWGAAFEVPDGYRVTVDGTTIDGDADVCTAQRVRIVGPDGATAWVVTPVEQSAIRGGGYAMASTAPRAEPRRRQPATSPSAGWVVSGVLTDQGDVVSEAKLDAVIDTLIRAWSEDPAAVRAAARRISRNFDRELRPQFEQLGRELSTELAPSLARVSDHVGRDLAPEFERLGTALGHTLADALGAAADELGAVGANDFHKPKSKR